MRPYHTAEHLVLNLLITTLARQTITTNATSILVKSAHTVPSTNGGYAVGWVSAPVAKVRLEVLVIVCFVCSLVK